MRLIEWASPAPRRRPRPRVRIDLEHSVPVWLVRSLVGAAVLVLVGSVIGSWPVVALVAIALVLVVHPVTVAGLTLLAALLLWAEPPNLATCAAMALALHLALVMVRLTAPLSVTGRVDRRLLLRAGGTFVVIQLVTQALIGLSFVALAGMPRAPWVAVVVLAAMTLGLVAAVRWVGRNTE